MLYVVEIGTSNASKEILYHKTVREMGYIPYKKKRSYAGQSHCIILHTNARAHTHTHTH